MLNTCPGVNLAKLVDVSGPIETTYWRCERLFCRRPPSAGSASTLALICRMQCAASTSGNFSPLGGHHGACVGYLSPARTATSEEAAHERSRNMRQAIHYVRQRLHAITFGCTNLLECLPTESSP